MTQNIHPQRRRKKWPLATLVLLVLAGGAAADPTPRRPTDPQTAAASTTVAREPAHRLLRDIEAGVSRVEPWLQRYGYGAVFVAVGVEGFGIPAPGQTILEAGSAISASANARLRIEPLLIDKIEERFERHGAWLILFARFFDGLRQLNGIAVGMLGMPWARFKLLNLAGAALWVCFWGLGVYYLDLDLDRVVAFIRRINPWVVAATLAGVAALVTVVWRRTSRRGAADHCFPGR